MNNSILIAEDDTRIAGLVNRYLSEENFTLLNAEDGQSALTLFSRHNPDLVILDLLLPKVDGTTVCEKIRTTSEVPIIMLTALNKERDLLSGFAKGADDYIAKPFNPRELVARVHALLRRTQQKNSGDCLAYENISLNKDERKVNCNGTALELTQMEFNLLKLLIANPKKAFTREELLCASHTSFTESNARSIDFHVKNLRRKINGGSGTNYIKTIYGVGFKLD